MKALTSVMLGIVLSVSGAVRADQVVEVVPDTAPGKAFGGLTGFMVGAAVGGPVGALVLGVGSAWAGGKFQEAIGLHGTAYRVEQADGTQVIVRAPNQTFAAGEQVEIDGVRLTR